MPTRKLYIVITQTGTILSRILKKITGAEYNYASVTLDPELRTMYSFGRKYAYFPLYGGFVTESADFGTFKRFSETRAVVLSISISEKIYDEIETLLNEMNENRGRYHYDNIGLPLAYFNIIFKRERYYYCSDFVRDLLVRFGVEAPETFMPIVQPQDFLDIPDSSVVFRGKLNEYSPKAVVQNV